MRTILFLYFICLTSLQVSAQCTPVSIVSQPQNVTAAPGTQATFSVSVAGTAPFTYFWYKNGSFQQSTTSPFYTTPTLTTADNNSTYYCLITNCSSNNEVQTNTVTLSVNAQCTPVSIVSQPQNVTAALGNQATFSVSVAGTAPFTYFWYKNGTFQQSTTSPSYTTPTLTAADNNSTYYCLITNCSSNNEVQTNTVTLTVNAPCTPVSIVTQPQNVTAAPGNQATFSVSVAGTAPFSYFWYKNGTFQQSTTSPSYTTPTLTAADNNSTYYCLITNCSSNNEVQTNTVTLTVNAPCTPVSIVTQPQGVAAIPGQQATFSVTVAGTAPFSYFWYKNNAFLQKTTIPSYTTPALSLSDNNATYYCLISNCNNGQEVQTDIVTLTVSPTCTAPSIVAQPQSVAAIPGTQATFSVTVTGTAPFSYFWYKNGTFQQKTTVPNYTTPSLTVDDNNSTYYCLISNCNNDQEVQSNTVTLTVGTSCIPVSIGSQPQGLTANLGNSAYFTVGVNGTGPFKYFWYKDGIQIIGASSSTYGRLNLTSTDAGFYYCIVTNCNNTYQAISNPAQLAISGNVSPTVPQQYGINNSGQQLTAAEPIQLGTGSYEYQHADLKMPAIGDSLKFVHSYNSINDTLNSPMGYGWSHSYNYVLSILKDPTTQADVLWSIHYSDGHKASFIPLNDATGRSTALYVGTTDSLQKNSGGDFTLFTTDNHKYHFTTAGALDQVTDLNGNTTTLTYTNNNLTSILTSGGRALNLSYNGNNIASVTDPLNRTVNFSYDGNGNLRSVTDANGGITSFTYDGNHNMLTALNALNNIIVSNAYDGNNRVISQQDAYGQTTLVAYDTPSTGDATVTNPDNTQFTVHHDSAFRKTYIKDELGFTKSYAYDSYSNENSSTDENGENETRTFDKAGNLLTRSQPGNATTTISYNNFNSPLQIIDPNGSITNFTYDGNDNLVLSQFPDQSNQSFTYLSNGLKQTFKDGNENQTTYNYSASGDLTSSTSFNGVKTYTYDAAGRKISAADENNNTTQYTYDNNDNIKTITDALGHTITYIYDANNQLLTVTDKKGNITSYTYDNKGRMGTKTDANGGLTKYTYDVRDNLVSVTDPNNNITTYTYDSKNRKTSTTNALGTAKNQFDGVGNLISAADGAGISTQYSYTPAYKVHTMLDGLNDTYTYSYDKNNNLLTVADPLNENTVYTYDGMNRVVSVIDAAGNTTKITYDAAGNKKTVSDPKGHTQTYSYDGANRLTSYLDAEGNTESYALDPAGNITLITKPTGTIAKTYDVLNRLVSVTNPGGSNYSFSYDNNGNIISSSSGIGTSGFSFDKLNRLTQYTDPFNNKVIYAYDAAGNKQYITYPDNKIVSYTYDNANNLKTVSDWFNHTFTYSYDAAGRVSQLLYPNGVQCNYTFDKAGRLASIINASINNTVLTGSIYTIDGAGNRTSEKKTGATPSKVSSMSQTFTYGNDDRLLKDQVWTYANDNAGNRISQGNGKVKETFAYTADNLLNSVLDTLNVATVYNYDANGHRLTRSVGSNNYRYVLDLSSNISRVLQITDINGIVRSQYVYGAGLLERIDSTNNVAYYHYDGQHNTVAMTDLSGAVTDTYSYFPFGAVVKHTGNLNQPFTYLGEFGVEQESSSLYYVRARYYDATTSRFISKDAHPYSLLNPQTINRYTYSTNNPLIRFDYSGLYQSQDYSDGGSSQYTNNGISTIVNGINYLNDQYNNLNDHWYSPLVSAALGDAITPIDRVSLAINITNDINDYRNKKASLFETTVKIVNDGLPTVAEGVGTALFGSAGGTAASIVASESELFGTWLVNKTAIGNKLTDFLAKKFFTN